MIELDYVEGLFLQAEQALEEGKLKEAKETLHEILSVDPSYGRAHHHLGWIYAQKLDHPDRAAYYYRLALKFSPEYPSLYINYAYLLFDIKDLDGHLDLIEKAIQLSGTSRAALHNERGRNAEYRGLIKEAINHYKKAIKVSLNDNEIIIYDDNIKRAKNKLPWLKRWFF